MEDKEKHEKVEEFLEKNCESKILNLIDNIHREVWSLTESLDRNMASYIATLFTVTAVMMYSLNTGKYLFLATIISQLALLWILAIIIESGYTYRYLQAISANIEKKFGGERKKCNWHGILPSSFQERKYGLREIHKIHFALFGTYFSILPWVFFVYGQPEENWLIGFCIVLLITVLVISLAILLCRCFIKTIEKSNELKKDENCTYILIIFLPFIICWILYFYPCIKFLCAQSNMEKVVIFLIWMFGVFTLFLYSKIRKENFYKNFPPEKNEKCNADEEKEG